MADDPSSTPGKLPVPPGDVDVRDLQPYIETVCNALNNMTATSSAGPVVGKFVVSGKNIIFFMNGVPVPPPPTGSSWALLSKNGVMQWGVPATGGGVASFPFQVLTRVITVAGTAKAQIGVIATSLLLDETGAPITVEGLLSADLSTGWLDTQDADKIWLEVLTPANTASISSLKSGDTFDAGRFQHDGGDGGTPITYTQAKLNALIATIALDGTTATVKQYMTTNQRLVTTSATAMKDDGSESEVIPVTDCIAI
jgi:hypothetical protein